MLNDDFAAYPSPPRGAARQPLRVVVTGGTSGLGLALVRAFHARGDALAFIARHAGRVQALAAELPGTHGIVADVAHKDEIHRIALQAAGALGGVDVLVNNASSLGPVPLKLLADTDCEALEEALATNLLGPFRLTKTLLGALAASARDGRGAVVLNVSSDAAVTPYAGWGAYGASKAALHHLSRIWAEELQAEGVRVLSRDPGDMDTPLHALAVPEADPARLKRPAAAARELIAAIDAALDVAAVPSQPSSGCAQAAAATASVEAPAAPSVSAPRTFAHPQGDRA
jgi:NAD(P)-dependent dehydrogenase (short-subunit alcohol dehydrogenase family)